MSVSSDECGDVINCGIPKVSRLASLFSAIPPRSKNSNMLILRVNPAIAKRRFEHSLLRVSEVAYHLILIIMDEGGLARLSQAPIQYWVIVAQAGRHEEEMSIEVRFHARDDTRILTYRHYLSQRIEFGLELEGTSAIIVPTSRIFIGDTLDVMPSLDRQFTNFG